MIKKKVRTSNLAIRCYFKDGWTAEDLEPIGKFVAKDEYFVLDTHCRIDIDKFMEQVSEVHRGFNDYPDLSDRDFLEKYNW